MNGRSTFLWIQTVSAMIDVLSMFKNGMVRKSILENTMGEYCDIAPGKWGIIDSKGDIVVAPQYVFAIGFYYGDGNHSAVARLKEGKLAWGVIDISGKETIPCQYSELYIPVDGYVVYRSEGSRLWGLMDYDGNVLADPQFEYIEGYDPEHRLITV
ncbi:MAG: WG repeat-containing protein, partial [Clostridia bacterium]|nr:WG repeat-containing protein [Clostridia bacterium]